MSELQTLKRTRQEARVPNVQGRLMMQFPDEGDSRPGGDGAAMSPVNRVEGIRTSRPVARMKSQGQEAVSQTVVPAPAYRKVIAGWTDAWRERWGIRANSLEDIGFAWRDAETQAFVEILTEIRESPNPSEQLTVASSEVVTIGLKA